MNDSSPAPLAIVLGMAAVTYLLRVAPLLGTSAGRIPHRALVYLRLVAPAVLAALAAIGVLVVVQAGSSGTDERSLHAGVEGLAVAVCVLIVATGRSLVFGLVAAVLVAFIGRQVGQ